MYWLDQSTPGLRKEIKPGRLGVELQNIHGHTDSTNIYAFRPPSGSGTQ